MNVHDVIKGFRARAADRVANPKEVAKRNGLYASRPVVNAQAWYDWAVKYGVPNPIAAADMHVTVVHSTKDVKIRPRDDYMIVDSERALFAMFGRDEDAFVVAFWNWRLQDRHWDFIAAGAVTSWPSYRPHLSISYDAADFEISDEAMANAPEQIVLGPEVYDEIRGATPASEANPEGLDGEDELLMMEVEDAIKSAAQQELDKLGETGNPVYRTALYDIAKRDSLPAGVFSHLLADDSQFEILKTAVLGEASEPADQSDDRRIVMVTKSAEENPAAMEIAAASEDEQMIVAIASVSTVDGELIKDLHGDEMTTQALIEFSRDLMKGYRAGQIDHDGNNRLEVVQSLVLSNDIQQALGINLGYEAYLVEFHVPEKADWEMVKSGKWGASIRGRMYAEGA